MLGLLLILKLIDQAFQHCLDKKYILQKFMAKIKNWKKKCKNCDLLKGINRTFKES